MRKIEDMILDLLDVELIDKNLKVVFTDEAMGLIHDIAKECKDFTALIDMEKKAQEYSDGMTPEDIYIDIVYKIVCAPSMILACATIGALIPILDQKLRSKLKDEKQEEAT